MRSLPRACTRLVLAVVLAGLASFAAAEDVFYDVRVADLELTEGSLPEYDLTAQFDWPVAGQWTAPAPYAALDGAGEAIVQMENRLAPWSFTAQNLLDARVMIRVPEAREVTGRLYLPSKEMKEYVITRFRIPADKHKLPSGERFYSAKVEELQQLLNEQAPGAAWFRHELRETQRKLNQAPQAPTPDVATFNQFGTDLDRTYALFSGGRALSENLALDRPLNPAAEATQMTVPLGDIEGITIAEIDWTKHNAGRQPKLDPLAKLIPSDQHAVFFPSFDAFVRAVDELKGNTAPVLRLTEPRAEDARSVARYETQLGVPLTAAARLLGGKVVKSVALTGGDPYFRVGTDVAFLFETDNPKALKEILLTTMKLNAQGAPDLHNFGSTQLDCRGFLTADRRISGYVAELPGAVLLTNSEFQVDQAAKVVEGQAASLASLPEFTFFRDRYPLGAEDETALVFLSDATIRRWCGPKWRIAGSRRTRDVAVLAEMQATYLEQMVRGEAQPGPIHTDLTMVSDGELMLKKDGVWSPVYNTLDFQTPISELALDKVTPEERDAYERWRDNYQRNWRWAFDPVGVRLTLKDDRLGADMTIMPLIANTEYTQFINITRGAKIAPDAGDRHDTMAHFIIAINRDALPVRQYAGLATAMAPGAKIDVLSWLGDTVSVYFDRDPFWAELLKPNLTNEDREKFLNDRGFAFPMAVRIDSKSNLKLAGFLTGLRAFIEQTAPNLTAWESLKHGEQAYVKIGATPQASQDGVPENAALYYSVVGSALVITPNEEVLKRAIDRQLARTTSDSPPAAEAAQPWLGENIALQADRDAAQAQFALNGAQYVRQLQTLSWRNLPILNEWKRRFPDHDPVKLHERFWQARLVCAGGGEYVWNEQYQTMESTVFGSPATPKQANVAPAPLEQLRRANFGLTFEEQGLRARVELEREAKR